MNELLKQTFKKPSRSVLYIKNGAWKDFKEIYEEEKALFKDFSEEVIRILNKLKAAWVYPDSAQTKNMSYLDPKNRYEILNLRNEKYLVVKKEEADNVLNKEKKREDVFIYFEKNKTRVLFKQKIETFKKENPISPVLYIIQKCIEEKIEKVTIKHNHPFLIRLGRNKLTGLEKINYKDELKELRELEKNIKTLEYAIVSKEKNKAANKTKKINSIIQTKKEIKAVKPFKNNYEYIIESDISSKEDQYSVIAGVLSKKNGEVKVEYRKKTKYNKNTGRLEAEAVLQMMKIAEMEKIEYALFKTDNEQVYNLIKNAKNKNLRKSVEREIYNYLLKKTHWNLEYVNRKEVRKAHKLSRKKALN